jgi:hypothetical protein
MAMIVVPHLTSTMETVHARTWSRRRNGQDAGGGGQELLNVVYDAVPNQVRRRECRTLHHRQWELCDFAAPLKWETLAIAAKYGTRRPTGEGRTLPHQRGNCEYNGGYYTADDI